MCAVLYLMPAAASIRHSSSCCIVCGLPLSYIRYLMQPQRKKSNGFKLVDPSYPASPDYSQPVYQNMDALRPAVSTFTLLLQEAII